MYWTDVSEPLAINANMMVSFQSISSGPRVQPVDSGRPVPDVATASDAVTDSTSSVPAACAEKDTVVVARLDDPDASAVIATTHPQARCTSGPS